MVPVCGTALAVGTSGLPESNTRIYEKDNDYHGGKLSASHQR